MDRGYKESFTNWLQSFEDINDLLNRIDNNWDENGLYHNLITTLSQDVNLIDSRSIFTDKNLKKVFLKNWFKITVDDLSQSSSFFINIIEIRDTLDKQTLSQFVTNRVI